MSKPPAERDGDFEKRRSQAREKLDAIDRDGFHNETERQAFFNTVYEQANGDAAFVPWADLKAKDQLEQWLARNGGIKSSGRLSAIDVACGLGDNAEALAESGYETTAFDLAADAIKWARNRFPDTGVDYRQADLFDLPREWHETFDLVHECYTLQALPPHMVEQTAMAIASLCKPGGTLLVFTRIRPDNAPASGPPWPLEENSTRIFSRLGFKLLDETRFTNEKMDRKIPHTFIEWRKTG